MNNNLKDKTKIVRQQSLSFAEFLKLRQSSLA